MFQIHVLILFILSVFFTSSCSTKRKEISSSVSSSLKNPQYSLKKEFIEIDHKYFKIVYDPNIRLARYVTYQIKSQNLRRPIAKRKNKFIPDPNLVKQAEPYVGPKEYVKTGYDRGHLAPSADFSWSQKANDLTFVMSNMAPQTPNLNRDAWKRLEEKVRGWACGEKIVTVITGPVIEDGLSKLESGLIIPDSFFKIIIDETAPKKVIAFVYNQRDKGDLLKKRMVKPKSLKKLAGVSLEDIGPKIQNLRMPSSLNDWRESDCRTEEK